MSLDKQLQISSAALVSQLPTISRAWSKRLRRRGSSSFLKMVSGSGGRPSKRVAKVHAGLWFRRCWWTYDSQPTMTATA